MWPDRRVIDLFGIEHLDAEAGDGGSPMFATALWRVFVSQASMRASMRFICKVPHS